MARRAVVDCIVGETFDGVMQCGIEATAPEPSIDKYELKYSFSALLLLVPLSFVV